MNDDCEKCEVCNGMGCIPGTMITHTFPINEETKKTYDNLLCPRCRGTGKEDWVRKITKSFSYEYPMLEETTEEVQKLIKEDKIFGTEGVVFEHKRRELLKSIGLMK